jgi:hypothetical protein
MLGFAPLTTRPLDTTPAVLGPYVRLANGAVNFQFTGAAPTSTDLTWAEAQAVRRVTVLAPST